MADVPTPIKRVFSGYANQDNLNIWGRLFIDQTGRGADGWLVDSWSVGGAPYWQAHMNWVTTKDKKIYLLQIGIHSQTNIYGEDTEIEPDRAEFIRASIAKWEREWLDEEAKRL
jgi:hypothetical protein